MNSNLKDCEICFEKIICKGILNSCDHHFHYKCIYRWSRISSNCPTCRKGFSEILKEFDGKVQKKIQLDENFQFCDDEFFNVDDEDWQVFCSKCHLSNTENLITCKGSFSCNTVVHRYCLESDVDVSKWLCPSCAREINYSEGSADESREENLDNQDYLDNASIESTQTSLIILDLPDYEIISVDQESQEFEINDYFIEDTEGRFVNKQIINFELPKKRFREKKRGECLEKFVRERVQKELMKNKFDKLSYNTISQTLFSIILRNDPKIDLKERKSMNLVKNFIKSYVSGIV